MKRKGSSTRPRGRRATIALTQRATFPGSPSSDARAIYKAIRQAIAFVESGIIDDITANISYMRVDKHAAKESD